MAIIEQVSAISTRQNILVQATELFYERGYHGTTVRQIAKKAGISVPTMFHHFENKMNILQEIMLRAQEDLSARTEAGFVETLDPVKGLSIAVRIHVTWHCEQQKASFVGNSELRSLEPSLKQQVIATRDAHQLRFDRALRDGVDAGIFETNDVKLVSRAIVTMTTAVATWYRPDGLYSPAELAELYVALALRMAGVVGERPTV